MVEASGAVDIDGSPIESKPDCITLIVNAAVWSTLIMLTSMMVPWNVC